MKKAAVTAFAFVLTQTAFASPNPAAVHCERFGGKNSIVQTSRGESGLCTFEDKSVCGDWAFFRSECAAGLCKTWDSENNKCAERIK